MGEGRERKQVSVFWFRRDLRLEDNTALGHALASGFPVLPMFIFDEEILEELPAGDPRVSFIHKQLAVIQKELRSKGSCLLIKKGKPLDVWEQVLENYQVAAVYANRDYEPYARDRDQAVDERLRERGVPFRTFKDQVIFAEGEVLKKDGLPYTVFTPYKRRWLEQFAALEIRGDVSPSAAGAFLPLDLAFPSLEELGFRTSAIPVSDFDLSLLHDYEQLRDFPAADATSHLSPHLRFGTVSIRQIIQGLGPSLEVFLSELIWREFFMQILFHFPRVVDQNFHSKYNAVPWRNDSTEFSRWCEGSTGYPLVDAGMRQLNATGIMHNRVRMVTASFLCKHLLIDWRWGEAYFARKLLDFELSSNNGNWQWAAGTGCDAAPYFRVFNPIQQLKRFDPEFEYVKKWIPEYATPAYPEAMVDHAFARNRALESYREGINAYLPGS